jgi:phage-related protein
VRHSQRKRGATDRSNLRSTAPALDPTDLGSALYDAQKGQKAPSAKPFKGVSTGVFEIALRFKTDAYRAVYAVQIGEQVYVLHAFQKKSKSGITTPPQDIETIKRRYRQAVEMEQGQ